MFQYTPLPEVVRVDNIVTVHCYDYAPNFSFPGESHDFWEMVFVDAGEVCIVADSKSHILGRGRAIFHKPGEHHSICANNTFASVVVITFSTQSSTIYHLSGKEIEVTDDQKEHISEILKEAAVTFLEPLNIVDQKRLIKKYDAPFGAEQMIKTHLEQLIISMLRNIIQISNTPVSGNTVKKDDKQIVERIIQILEDNIYGKVLLDDICKQINFSKSYIKTVFKKAMGLGVHQQHLRMKISLSKKLLNDPKYSISDISEMLGFSSIHHFSKTFKQLTGMPPQAYRTSVRRRALL